MKNAFFTFFSRVKFVFLSFMCIFCSIIFFACSNLFSPENSLSDGGKKDFWKMYEINGNLFVDGSSPKIFENTNQARSVSAEIPGAIFYAVIAKNAGNSEKSYTAEVDGSAFSIKLSKGTWNITAEGFSDAEKTVSILKGSASVSVEDENSVKSGISIKMFPQKDGKGNISLSIEAENGSGIKSVLAELKKNDESGSVYSECLNLSSNSAKIEKSDISSGVYVLSLKFYSEDSGSGELLYTAQEIVNVFNNLTTGIWNGNSVYINGGNFFLSKSAVESFKMKTFFVQGESEATYSPVTSADDSNAGTYFAPLATVQKAVDKINVQNDGSSSYTVFVDGTVTADAIYGNYSANNSSFVNISPSAKLNLTIKSLSSEKAVVDAGRDGKEADTTGWRVFYIGSNADIVFENITVKGGSLNEAGGGIYCGGNLTLKNCVVEKNKSNNAGGGICFSGKELALENTSVSYNKSSSSGGGINADGKVTISDSEILNNSAADNGGGIYFGDGEKTISGTTVNKNSAVYGGGIYVTNGSSSRVTVKIGKENSSTDDVLIEKNCAAERGGAFYCADNTDIIMYSGSISENYSNGSGSRNGGGAIFIWGGSSTYSTFTMSGGEMSGNMAKNGGAGGAVHIDHGDGVKKSAFIMTGGLLSGNKAADEKGNGSKLGGAIYVNYGGQIKLGGSAVIAVEDDGNDIWLANDRKITVTDELAPENNAAAGNPKYTARVTLQGYTSGKTVVEGSSSPSYMLTQEDCKNFKIVDDSGNLYEVKLDSSENTGDIGLKLTLNEQNKTLGFPDSIDSDLLNFAFSYIDKNSENTWTLNLNDKSVDDLQTVTVSSGMSVLFEGDEEKHAQLSCPNKNSDDYTHIRVNNGGTLTLKNIDLKGDVYGNFCQYALFVEAGGKVVLENTTISGFKNNGDGPIYVKGELDIGEGVAIKDNKARYGAGFYVVSGGIVIMNGGEITENTCVNGNRVVYIGSGSRFEWNSGTISNNKVGSATSIKGDFVNNSGNDMS